jgi:hypothetical protein
MHSGNKKNQRSLAGDAVSNEGLLDAVARFSVAQK